MKSYKFSKGLVFALVAILGFIFFQDLTTVDPITGALPSLSYTIGHALPSLAVIPVTTVFAKDIEANIFPDNAFYMQSKDDSAFVDNDMVRYPVSGVKPNVEVNRTQLPAPITKRTDDNNDYYLSEFTSDPTLITDSEELIVNYAKRSNVLSDHQETINTKVAEFFANLWLPNGASNIVRSTGTTTRTASAPSATGTRKKVTKDDIIKLAEIMNRMDAPLAGRNLLIPAEFQSDILSIDQFVDANKIGTPNLIKGSVGMLLGFNIFVRSSVGVYDNTGTPVKKAIGAAGATSDNLAALAWNSSWVNRAKGNVKVYANMDQAEYYGSIFSAMVRAGGKTRKDLKGVIALVEAA